MATTKRAWPYLVTVGVLLVLTGVAALGAELVAGMLTVMVIGWLLAVGGAVELIQSFPLRGTSNFAPALLGGLISFFAGVVLVIRPGIGAEALVVLLGGYFVAGGAFRVITSITQKQDEWGWAAFAGVVDLTLGIVLWNNWAGQSVTIIGLFVGITLILRGIPWIVTGFAIRRLSK
ncbi:MAG TPA: DUF308 domain-containing protein [Gemmatimonadaceae bacterium]|nr:DUF308 domain-containing protein [Gemmatimonadaceae bacterium]